MSRSSMPSSKWNTMLTIILVFVSAAAVSAQSPGIDNIRIDCGFSGQPYTQGSRRWIPDAYFAGGEPGFIQNANDLGLESDRPAATVRSFGPTEAACYQVPVPPGRYLVRTGFSYGNFDNLTMPPAFAITVEGVTVQRVDLDAWQVQQGDAPFYTDFLAPVTDGNASVCLVGAPNQGRPLISSLEILPQDALAYAADLPAAGSGGGAASGVDDVILSMLVRINCGGPAVGPAPEDIGNRTWAADPFTPKAGKYNVRTVQAGHIVDADLAPDYVPRQMLRTVREALPGANTSTGFTFPSVVPASPTNTWLLVLYMAEYDASVRAGDRTFFVRIGGGGVSYDLHGNATSDWDLLAVAAPGTAVVIPIRFNLTQGPSAQEPVAVTETGGAFYNLQFAVVASPGSKRPPILSGVELFELIPTTAAAEDGRQNATRSIISRHSRLTGGAVAGVIVAAILLLAAVVVAVLAVRMLVQTRKAAGQQGSASQHHQAARTESASSTSSFIQRASAVMGIGRSASRDGQVAEAAGQYGARTPYERFNGHGSHNNDNDFTDVELSGGGIGGRR